MKIVKPMAVSFSFRTSRRRRQAGAVRREPDRLQAWRRSAAPRVRYRPLDGDWRSDGRDRREGLPKARGEVLVYGSCHAPAGAPLPSAMVRVRVTAVDALPDARPLVEKKLAVFGDRYWSGTASKGPTDDPVPSDVAGHASVAVHRNAARLGPRLRRVDLQKNPLGRRRASRDE